MEFYYRSSVLKTLHTYLMRCIIFLFFFNVSISASQNPTLTPIMNSLPATSSADRIALLSFRSLISDDPSGSLTSWNDSLHLCDWRGVTCGSNTRRVTALDLASLGLVGSLSPALANLTYLRRIHLPENKFHGDIPQELGCLPHLRYLNLSSNSLEGGIPASLSHCSHLQTISLDDNKLQGVIPGNLSQCSRLQTVGLSKNMLQGYIPMSFVNLSSLTYLQLSNNSLTGAIPYFIGSMSTLNYLDLSANNFIAGIPPPLGNLSTLAHLDLSQNNLEGGIPPSLGKLSSLTFLYLAFNSLSGVIPPALWNLSSLTLFGVGHNKLHGTLPSYVGDALPQLRLFYLYGNQFHGPIPMSFSNTSILERIDLSQNKFSGIIPPSLGRLQGLLTVVLAFNMLEAREATAWSFLDALANCSNLRGLQLDSNMLGGMLPKSVANLSTTLTWLSLGDNQIYGSIPSEIKNLGNLTLLDMGPNLLTGHIPATLGMLQNLHVLDLDGNNFFGKIPMNLGNLTQLNRLYLGFNKLNGNIPTNLGNCQNLEYLSLDYNNLTGSIPVEVLDISSLSILLGLSHNSLTGPLPSTVGSLENLNILDVSENKLSGEIPDRLGECQVMEYLNMRGNFFNGTIPLSLGNLKGLLLLDLSCNNLSGHIPEFLESLRLLQNLNLSFNNLEGEVPKGGVFGNISAISVQGNSKLCGGNSKMNLPPCPIEMPLRRHKSPRLKIVISIVVSAILCLILFFYLFAAHHWSRKSRRESSAMISIKDQHMKVSYADLLKATNGFSHSNLIGVGSFGSVYKGIMDHDDHKVVAVKVLNLQQHGASRSFFAECEALRNIRHRNLVKILTSCSSMDYRGNDFKALVFEFFSNGSLEKWLHPESSEQSNSRKLSLTERLNIAIDVASAVEYLHYHGPKPIVHCDLKPSNVLLSDDMTARVSDFGLARFLNRTISNSFLIPVSSMELKGSIGYVAPEYGLANKVSTNGDVYSFGILLLELFTGKRPTDDLFREGFSLHKLVQMAFPHEVLDIMDPCMVLQEEDGEASDHTQNWSDIRGKAEKCIASVLNVGLLCSKESPIERMQMMDVTGELHAIRDALRLDILG
uniref:Receptor kinase-like protein Xa21 n=2 Tax=Elaeis guineensis var. tenera TaxID=51953 RepID=A0A6J0PGF5_ELAGV|nr:probable LRR receptor-like serine/threonine-protein kinase At3g47570 [Elaeis guineensis]